MCNPRHVSFNCLEIKYSTIDDEIARHEEINIMIEFGGPADD